MPLDGDQASVTIRTNVRRGYALDSARAEARAILLVTDAFSDLSNEQKRRVIRFVASKYGLHIDKGWLQVNE